MARAPDDWRLTGQESYLRGVSLAWQPYRAHSAQDHGHCEFCWAKFMDPSFSEGHRRFIEETPDVLTNGFATAHEKGAPYHWVCKQCFDDFAALFAWRVVQPD